MKFYAKFDLLEGTGLSPVFEIASFNTKTARDAWCANNDKRVPVTRLESLKVAPPSIHYLTDDNKKFTRAY